MPSSRPGVARRGLPLPTLLALCAIGCGSGSGERHPEPGTDLQSATLTLCDGSDDVRFSFVAGLGPREPMLAFGARYGQEYVAIDGSCRFWIYDLSLQGLRSGTLDRAYANGALANALHLGHYADLEDVASPICVDGGGVSLWDTTGTLVAGCPRSSDERGPLAESFIRAQGLLAELAPRSTPVWARTRLLPLTEALLPLGVPAPSPQAAWTGGLDLGSASISAVDYTNGVAAPDGLLVEDAATLELLRELRAAGVARGLDEYLYPGLFLTHPAAGEVQLLLRDEPPPAVARAIGAVPR